MNNLQENFEFGDYFGILCLENEAVARSAMQQVKLIGSESITLNLSPAQTEVSNYQEQRSLSSSSPHLLLPGTSSSQAVNSKLFPLSSCLQMTKSVPSSRKNSINVETGIVENA